MKLRDVLRDVYIIVWPTLLGVLGGLIAGILGLLGGMLMQWTHIIQGMSREQETIAFFGPIIGFGLCGLVDSFLRVRIWLRWYRETRGKEGSHE
jgi:H+/Cl- antiporter ClcA